MECVFGIDVSKENANVAVLVDNVVIKQFKIARIVNPSATVSSPIL